MRIWVIYKASHKRQKQEIAAFVEDSLWQLLGQSRKHVCCC